jgi:hypothetical protein
MPINGRWEKCSINTGEGSPGRTGAITRPVSAATVWSRWWSITTLGRRRYESLDKDVQYRVEFRTHVSINMVSSRITRTADGDKIYEPVSSAESLGSSGMHSILVRDTGMVAP